MKKILKILATLILVVLIIVVALFGYLWLHEYRPAPIETIELPDDAPRTPLQKELRLITWNIGYAGLGKESDFFMDGGKMVNPPSREAVQKNMRGIETFLQDTPADIFLLQEVDRKSKRSDKEDQAERLAYHLDRPYQYAPNYRCRFVPYPLPMIGKVESGLVTMCDTLPIRSERHALPVPFDFPVRLVNLKRCLLVNRYPVDNGRELVVINLHLEAYDDGEGKAAQTIQLLDLMQSEYDKGNYVVAGGDWNQYLDTESVKRYKKPSDDVWKPASLDLRLIPAGWRIAVDISVPSYRTNNIPYDPASPETYVGVIDGYLLSPNITVRDVKTMDLSFEYSDHQPVILDIRLND